METGPIVTGCPVCGMRVASDGFTLKLDEGGYTFCSPQHGEKFMQDHDLYAVPAVDNAALK